MFKILKLQKFGFMGDDMYADGAKSLLLSYRLLERVEFIDLRTLLYNLKVFFSIIQSMGLLMYQSEFWASGYVLSPTGMNYLSVSLF